MECGEGMIAVVRGLRDSALAVTLLDGGRHYTLQPEAVATMHASNSTSSQCANNVVRRESAVQATDARYASTYKMMHCHVVPTSPHTEVTEFPPQRAELCPGQGNFEIGGQGSCEKHRATKSNSFKGGLSWPDKGAVFTSRPSVQPDAFANSLRKYPNMSPERSTEVMERLINYAQSRSVTSRFKPSSPTRNVESDSSTFNLEGLRTNSRPHKSYEENKQRRIDESPTRERSKRPADFEVESWRRGTFSHAADVRYLKDVTRAVREGIKGMSANNQPEKLPRQDSPSPERRTNAQKSCNSVNMEIQAQNLSKNVSTAHLYPKRSILLYELHTCVQNNRFLDSKTASIKSSISYFDITRTISQNSLNSRNCKSQRSIHEQLKLDKRELLMNWIHDIFNNEDKRRMWNKKLVKIAKKLTKPAGEIEVRKNIENFIKNKKAFEPPVDTDYIINHVIELIKTVHVNKTPPQFNVFHATTLCNDEKSYLKAVIKTWIKKLPIKNVDSVGRPVNKNNIIEIATSTLLAEISDVNRNSIGQLKSNILNALSDIPVDIKFDERSAVLKRNVNKLIKMVLDAEDELIGTKLSREGSYKNNMDMRSFISTIIAEMLDLHPLPLDTQNLNYLRLKLVNMISTKLSFGKLQRSRIKEDIYYILTGVPNLSKWKVNKYTNIFINYIDNVFDGFIVDDNRANWIDAILNACNSESNIPKEKKLERCFNNTNDVHLKRQLTYKISEWLEGFKCQTPELKDKNYITIAAKDLSNSIISRYKFLQYYPNRPSTRREMDFLKYLIMIWLNKVIGRDSTEILQNVNVLLDKIVGCQNRCRVKAAKSEDLSRKQSTFSKMNLMKKNSEYLKTVINGVPTEFVNLKTCETEVKISNTSNDLTHPNKLITRARSIKLISLADPYKNNKAYLKDKSTLKDDYNQIEQKELTDHSWLTNSVIDYNVCVLLNRACPSDCRPIQCLYNHYSNIFTSHCNRVPMEPIPDENREVIKRIILNNVWKVYYRLVSDPQTESVNFKVLFDDQFEESLTNTERSLDLKILLKSQLLWKKELSYHVNNMYHRVQNIKQGIKFRQTFEDVIRKELRISLQPHQKVLLMKILDQYVMYSKYKDDKVFKSFIYRKRLVQYIELLIKDGDIKAMTTDIIRDEMFKMFEKVGDDILENEAIEVLFREEFEAWLKPFSSAAQTDADLNCLKEIIVLAKNVITISKVYSGKEVVANEIKKEIEKYLTTEIQSRRISPECLNTINDFLNKWQNLNNMFNNDRLDITKERHNIVKKGQNNVIKVESRVHFEDLTSECSNNVSAANREKLTSILKESRTRVDNVISIADSSDDSEIIQNKACRGCKVEVISYKENVHLEGSDHSLTIINDIPPQKSTGLQADLPVCEGTNTEHLFFPQQQDVRKQIFPSKIIYVVDKYSQTSLDRSGGRGNYCQKCRVLIESNKKIRWSDVSEDSDYDDTESY